ncbi:unnamed protein product, partial [Didymodactylos carnosus]
MIKKRHRSFGKADLIQPTNHYSSRNEIMPVSSAASSSSIGKFLSNRLRDSIHYTRSSSPPTKHAHSDNTVHLTENFDEADYVATPEPLLNDNFNYYHRRPLLTPSSTSSNVDSYLTHTSPDTKKFSRHVELSSGYNILKDNNRNKSLKLPNYRQGRTPLTRVNTLQHQKSSLLDEEEFPFDSFHQRRLSFNNRLLNSTSLYNNKHKFQYNNDGSRRPFSSDSPVPPPTQSTRILDNNISSAPPVHNRQPLPPNHYHETNNSTESNLQQQQSSSISNPNLPLEPLKFKSSSFAVNTADNEEDDSIAALSRELRAAAYPSNRKQSLSSPTRDIIATATNTSASPPTSRYSTRNQTKRTLPRSLPKLTDAHSRKINYYHQTSSESNDERTDDLLQSSSATTLLLDQFFSLNTQQQQERSQLLNITGSEQSELVVIKTTLDLNNSTMNDLTKSTSTTTRKFLSKYARLAPITTTHQVNIATVQRICPKLKRDTNNISVKKDEDQPQNVLNYINNNCKDENVDVLSEDYLSNMNLSMPSTLDNDRSNQSELIGVMNDDVDSAMDNTYDYAPFEQQHHDIIDIPLLELDELETASDICESQLVPIVYAKDLENEIALLQKAHQAKQQQRREQREAHLLLHQQDEDDRLNDNNSVPPPANIELLNFDTLDDEVLIKQECVNEILSAATALLTLPTVLYKSDDTINNNNDNENSFDTMDISLMSMPSFPIITTSNIQQHTTLAHNRLCLWYRLSAKLWFKILSYLNQNELYNFSQACKRFYLLVQDQACQHRTILYRKPIIEQQWLHTIARRKPIALAFIECGQQNLEQDKKPTSDSQINNDFKLSNHMNIAEWNEFFNNIRTNLTDMTITNCYYEPFTPNFLLPIIFDKCNSIKTLNISWNNLTPVTFTLLFHHQLSSLDLSGCQTLTDSILTQLFFHDNNPSILSLHLIILKLAFCVNITWSSLTVISEHLKSLKHLNIRQCIGLEYQFDNDNLNCFQYWSNLEYLDMSQLLSLTDNDILKLTINCKSLKQLYLDSCINLTDQTLYTIGNNLQLTLELISLENCVNIQQNIAYLFLIQQCLNLRSMNLSFTCVSDEYIRSWINQSENNLNYLEILSLNSTKCTYNGIKIILDSCK